MSRAGRRSERENTVRAYAAKDNRHPVRDSVPDLSWLADSPIFIDNQQIGVFYDAVVGPAFRTVELQISATQTQQLEKSTMGRLSAGMSRPVPLAEDRCRRGGP
jgi:hypothetical protein